MKTAKQLIESRVDETTADLYSKNIENLAVGVLDLKNALLRLRSTFSAHQFALRRMKTPETPTINSLAAKVESKLPIIEKMISSINSVDDLYTAIKELEDDLNY